MPTLHVHVDESGNFDFSLAGSHYYIFTAAWTYNPSPLANDLTRLRFGLIKAGHFTGGQDLDCFHAADDPAPRRDAVINTLLSQTGWNFASIVVDKPRVNPVLYDAFKFYPKFLSMVLRFVFKGRLIMGTSQVLVYTDTLPFPKKQSQAVEIAIKASCHADLPAGTPFHVCHHRRESNKWIQVADYCCWSVCRKWEHGNLDAYNRLRAKLAATEIDPMSRGDGTTYY